MSVAPEYWICSPAAAHWDSRRCHGRQPRSPSWNAQSRVARALADNITTLSNEGPLPATVITADVIHWLQSGTPPEEGVDLVLLDPPFRLGLAAESCELLESRGWLKDGAMIYLEVEAELTPQVPANWQLHRESRAGDSHGRLYRRQQPA